MMRRIVLFAGLLLGLGACQVNLPDFAAKRDAPAEASIIGDEIEVSSLDPVQDAKASEVTAQAAAPLAKPGTADRKEGQDAPTEQSAATAEDDSPPKAADEVPAAAEAKEEAVAKSPSQIACERRKGIWEEAAQGAAFFCQMPTSDGGKQCRKSTDCEGYCLARSGTCAPISPMFGCQDILNEDGRMLTECIN